MSIHSLCYETTISDFFYKTFYTIIFTIKKYEKIPCLNDPGPLPTPWSLFSVDIGPSERKQPINNPFPLSKKKKKNNRKKTHFVPEENLRVKTFADVSLAYKEDGEISTKRSR